MSYITTLKFKNALKPQKMEKDKKLKTNKSLGIEKSSSIWREYTLNTIEIWKALYCLRKGMSKSYWKLTVNDGDEKQHIQRQVSNMGFLKRITRITKIEKPGVISTAWPREAHSHDFSWMNCFSGNGRYHFEKIENYV